MFTYLLGSCEMFRKGKERHAVHNAFRGIIFKKYYLGCKAVCVCVRVSVTAAATVVPYDKQPSIDVNSLIKLAVTLVAKCS